MKPSMLVALFVGLMSFCALQKVKAQEFIICDKYNYTDVYGPQFALRDLNTEGIDLIAGHLILPASLTCYLAYIGWVTAPVEQLGWGFQICGLLQNANSLYKTTVTGITLPATCKRVVQNCFYNSGTYDFPLQFLDAPGVIELQANAFRNQKNLNLVNIPAIEKIGGRAFENCSALTSITLPVTLKEIGECAFENSGLTSIVLQEVEAIWGYAFKGTAIKSINLPPSLIRLPSTSLGGCADLKTIYYNCPDLVANILGVGEQGSFKLLENPNCHIIIGNNLSSIKEVAFYASKAAAYTIPNTIKCISKNAFYENENLKKIEIPSSVDSIHYSAFSWSGNLKQIMVHWETPLVIKYSGAQYGLQAIPHSKITLVVPQGTLSLYKTSPSWEKFFIMENVELSVAPQTNSAKISWYKVPEATGYTITVYTDEAQTQEFGKYNLDGNGQKGTRLSYTISGLSEETPYWYKFEVKKNTSIIATFEEKFATHDEVSIHETKINNISIYPNPTTGQLTIDNGELKMNSIEIFDVYGRIIVNCQLSIVNSIDISDLSNGVYFLKISTEKGMVTKKIVKY